MIHIDSIRKLTAKLMLAFTLAFAMNAIAPSIAAAQGGPVLIIGIDPENGPPGSHGPVSAYRGMVNTLLSQTSNSGTGLLIIGGGKNPADYVTQFWNAVAAIAPALPITHANNAQISVAPLNNYKLVVVVSDFENIAAAWGGLTAAEWQRLVARKAELRQFVNCGGGMLAMCAPQPTTNPNWYNFLTFPGNAQISYQTQLGGFAANPANATLLPAATTVGQNVPLGTLLASNADLWHNFYTSVPSAISPLVRFNPNNLPIALGTAALYVNSLPLANAGADQTIECTSHTGMSVTLDGSGSDADGDPLTYQWYYNNVLIGSSASITLNNLMCGSYTFTLKVSDNQCGSTTNDVVVDIVDTTPPVISGVGADASVECPADPYAAFSSPTAADACDPNPTFGYVDAVTPSCGGTYSVTRTWTATDAFSNSSSASQTITVEDNTAPAITTNADVSVWPPNHSYVSYGISDMVGAVYDACGSTLGAGDVTIHSVWSDEVEEAAGLGDGETFNDIVIACDFQSVMLRKERQGGGNGRVYTVKLQLSDGCNTGYAYFKVSVPHTSGGTAVDDGAAAGYTVSACSTPKDIARNGAVPAGMALSQNYPNPFNPTTTISFTVPAASDVTLTVSDMNGREVATVANGRFDAGAHTLVFDASALPSGLYMYRLESNGAVLSRVMQLVK